VSLLETPPDFNPAKDPLQLSFASFGDCHDAGWWFFFRYNTFALGIPLLAVPYTVVGLLVRGFDAVTLVLLVWTTAIVASSARYFHLAIADSKGETKRLSMRAFWWCMVIIAEALSLLVILIWFGAHRS